MNEKRNIFLLILSLVLVLGVSSCGESDIQKSETATSEKEYNTAENDKNDYRISELRRYDENGVLTGCFSYEYDETGNYKERTYTFYSNLDSGDIDVCKTIYDIAGIPVKKYKNGVLQSEHEPQYEYDENGNIVKVTYIAGDVTYVVEMETIKTTNLGYLLVATNEKRYKDGIFCEYVYEYSDYGDRTKVYEREGTNGELLLSSRTEYEYDSHGEVISEIEYDENDEVKSNITYQNQYDTNGNVIRRDWYDENGDLMGYVEMDYVKIEF